MSQTVRKKRDLVINKELLGKSLLFLTALYSILNLFPASEINAPAVLGLIKLLTYSLFIVCSLCVLLFIQKAHYLLILFFFITLIPIIRIDFFAGDLNLSDRTRWLFYTATILTITLNNIKIWINVLYGMMVLNIVILILYPDVYFPIEERWDFVVENFPNTLFFGSLFFFGIQKQFNISKRVFLYIVFFITLGAYIIFARRSGSAHLILFLLAPIFVSRGNILKRIGIGIGIICILFSVSWIYINYVSDELFLYLLERIDVNSRSEINDLALGTLKNWSSWIFGIGVQGGYSNPMVDLEGSPIRTNVETGALDIIMDGGILLWVSLMAISLYAVYMGYFRSKNTYVRTFAYAIFIYVIMQYPIPQPGMGMYGFLVFSAIGICLNNKYRNLTDKEITKLFL